MQNKHIYRSFNNKQLHEIAIGQYAMGRSLMDRSFPGLLRLTLQSRYFPPSRMICRASVVFSWSLNPESRKLYWEDCWRSDLRRTESCCCFILEPYHCENSRNKNKDAWRISKHWNRITVSTVETKTRMHEGSVNIFVVGESFITGKVSVWRHHFFIRYEII